MGTAALVLGGVTGGVGKTTLALAITAALRQKGRTVRSYSVGPGLSPGAAALDSSPGKLPDLPVSLDGWLLSQDSARAAFHSLSEESDISIIEGCLGMFDSPTPDGSSEQGSTAQITAWLQVPLVLVIDASAFSSVRALIALIKGYTAVDGSVPVAAVILNKVASKALARELQEGLRQAALEVAVLGAVPKMEEPANGSDCSTQQAICCPWSPTSPSTASIVCGASSCTNHRHQQQLSAQQLAEVALRHIDLEALQALAATAAVPLPEVPLPPSGRTFRVSVGVAHDEAFFRYFSQNLHMLQCAGVQLVPFSPLHDSQLPPGLSALLLGGGAVPDWMPQLAGNGAMLEALRAFAGAGGLVIGEADGLMYLSKSLQLQGGQRQQMVGLLPFHTQALGGGAGSPPSPVSVTVQQSAHPLLLPGSLLKGFATCCCQVVEERLVGGLSAALAAAAAPAAAAAAAAVDAQDGNGVSSAAATGATTTVGAFSAATGGLQSDMVYSYSYSCVPRGQPESAAVPEGYTCGTVLGSCVQVHYGSCPEVVQHLAQRCLRVDVASVTAAASDAASQAAARAAEAAAAAASPAPAHTLQDAAAAGHPRGMPSPGGNRALSAPDLQHMMWQYQQYSSADAIAATSSSGQQEMWSGVGSPLGSSGMAAAAAFMAGKKSASIPMNMYQMGTPDQMQQQMLGHSPHVGSFPGPQQAQQGGGGGSGGQWGPLPFHVPKRWSLELQRLGSFTSQLLPGGKGPQQQQQQPQQGTSSRPGHQHHLSHHSRSSSYGMMHLPEEAPLSDAAIQLLDSSMPSLLGRTHHTHIGVAVPLSLAGAATAAAVPSAGSAGGQTSAAGASCTAESLCNMSKSSSIHEQMSCLAASLAQQEAAAASTAASQCEDVIVWPDAGPCHAVHLVEQQQPQQVPVSRLSLDQHAAHLQQQQQQGAPESLRSRVSFDSALISGSAQHYHYQQQQQQQQQLDEQPQLCAELSFKALVPAANSSNDHPSAGAAAAASNGISKSSSSHKLNGWHAPPAVASSAGCSDAGAVAGGRIISLSPAATDCLVALGLSSRLAGVTDACRVVRRGLAGNSPLVQLLDSIGAGWAASVAQQTSGGGGGSSGGSCGKQAADLPVVCRLVEGPDGLPRYKLDEDHIRQVQPSLVVVACDENSDDEPHVQHYKQLQAEGVLGSMGATGAAGTAGPAAASAGGSGGSGNGSGGGGWAWPFGAAGQVSSAINSVVAVPGRVRLEAAVVQRVLQRAGVLWPEQRAVVLYQRCHSLSEVLEFMLVLAHAAGVPERGEVLVQGLRARLRTAAGRLLLSSSSLLARGNSTGSSTCSYSTGSSSRRSSGSESTPLRGQGRRTVMMVLESTTPLRLAGFWVPEMLDMVQAGHASICPTAAEPTTTISWSQLRAAAPDILVLAPSGLDAAQAALHTIDLAGQPGFWSLPAVRAGAVYVCDHTLLMRPGPELVLGVELLGHLLAPDKQPLPSGMPMGSVLKLTLHSGQRCRPRLVPNYLSRYC